MDKDIIALVKAMLKRDFVTTDSVKEETNSTMRQIMYRLNKLNDILALHGLDIIHIGEQKEFLIPEDTGKFLWEIFFEVDDFFDYNLNREERKTYLYLWLFIGSEYLSLQHFLTQFKISRSTALQDFKELTTDIERYNLDITYDRQNGYALVGNEIDRRRYMIKEIIYTLALHPNTYIFDKFINDFGLKVFDYYRLIIQELASDFNIDFVEDRLVEFIYIFIILSERIKQDEKFDYEETQDIEYLSSFKEYQFTQSLIKYFELDSKATKWDVYYITSWILGISIGDINEDTHDRQPIIDIVTKIIDRFEVISGLKINNYDKTFEYLFAHFRAAYYRILFNIPIYNPLTDRVKENYSSLFILVKETMRPIYESLKVSMDDAELAYLTIHFSSIYNVLNEIEEEIKNKALIICLEGVGTSALLYNELSDMFPNLNFYNPISASEFNSYDYKPDIIFTTKIFKQLQEHSPKVIKVKPLMSIDEKFELHKDVHSRLGSNTAMDIQESDIKGIIRKYFGKVSSEELLIKEILNYVQSKAFTQKDVEISKESYLEDMFDESIMLLQQDIESLEEAIYIIGQKMIEESYITQEYLDRVMEIQKDNPTYFAITPEISLPHTNVESGIKQPGFGLLTLKHPITIGESSDYELKTILFLSPKTNDEHIDMMSEFLTLLQDETFLKMLGNTQNKQELLEYIKEI